MSYKKNVNPCFKSKSTIKLLAELKEIIIIYKKKYLLYSKTLETNLQ